jgi:hypothetical protein
VHSHPASQVQAAGLPPQLQLQVAPEAQQEAEQAEVAPLFVAPNVMAAAVIPIAIRLRILRIVVSPVENC